MLFHRPSSFSLGYPSYPPRRSYRPASFYEYDEPSGLSASALEDLAYSPLPPTFPPRRDPETRYRRALYELEAAEEEYEAHVAVERARQVALARQRAAAAAAAEAARRDRAHAIQAEIERVERTRALQGLIEERLAKRQHSLRPRAAFGRAPCQGRALLHALVDANAEEDFAPRRQFSGCPRARSQCTRRPARPINGTSDVADLLELLTGVHSEPEPVIAAQKPTPRAEPQPESQPQSQPEPEPAQSKRSDAEVTLGDIMEFFQGIVAQARDAAGSHQSTHKPNAPSEPEAAAADKGKGKVKAEHTPELSLFQTLFRGRMNGAFDQEMRDIEQAIKLSLEDRSAGDAKKAHASKTARSSPGASSSKVKIEEPSSSGRAASPARSAASTSNSTVVPQPASPLTTIRAVRSQFSALESAFKLPPVLDFDHSELAVSPNNAPVRAYEHALNGLLEQLDAIESDGDEELRNVRRDVVREVERALEAVEEKVRERTPQGPVPEATKDEVNGYDVESGSEEPEARVVEDVLLVKVSPSVKDARPTLADPAPLASPADGDVNLAIYEEYRSGSPVAGSSEVVAAEPDNAAPAPRQPVDEGVTSPDAADAQVAHAFGDPSGSIARIIPATPADSVPTPAHGSPDPETFLTSMSHDQFTFPPKSLSQSGTGPSEAHDDAVLVEDSSEGEGGSAKGAEDGWSEVDA